MSVSLAPYQMKLSRKCITISFIFYASPSQIQVDRIKNSPMGDRPMEEDAVYNPVLMAKSLVSERVVMGGSIAARLRESGTQMLMLTNYAFEDSIQMQCKHVILI